MAEEEAKKQHEIKVIKAQEFYNELVRLWENTGNNNTLAVMSLEQADTVLVDCDNFISMIGQIPNIPCFGEVFQGNCYSIDLTDCHNKDFGIIPVEKIDDKTVKLNFNYLEKRVEKYRQKIEAAISSTNDFKRTIKQIIHVDITPNLEATRQTDQQITTVTTSNITAKTSLSRLSLFYVIDVETTGLNPLTDEIIQITALRFLNFKPVDTFTTYVRPHDGLNSRAQKINGITEEDVKNAPYIEQIIEQFDAFLTNPLKKENPPIVGHNVGFDFQFLRANKSKSMVYPRKFYDTLELSKRQYNYLSAFKLDYVIKAILGIFRADAHDSLSDSLASGLLFKKICEDRIGFKLE